MAPASTDTQGSERRRTIRGLLFLLVLLPLVMSGLICCGQVAMLIGSGSRVLDTRSMLKADYGPWGYEKVRAINLAGFKEDFLRDQVQAGVAAVVPGEVIDDGVFWPTGGPTPAEVAGPVGESTPTFESTPTGTNPLSSATSTVTPLIATATRTPTTSSLTASATALRETFTQTPVQTATQTSVRTSTFTPVQTSTVTQIPSNTPRPTATRTSTLFVTRTPTFPPPTFTFTPEPPPAATNTPAPTRTFTMAPTRTFTMVPTSTFTSLPPTATRTFTPIPVIPTPTFTFTPVPTATQGTPPYAPVRPIAENGGLADPDPGNPSACIGFFGYKNDNPYDVDIPHGSLNQLVPGALEVQTYNPPSADLPTHFYVDRWTGNVQVKWDSGTDITWNLDGRSATLFWCR